MRTAIPVNREALVLAVAKAETKKPKNWSLMLNIAADLYNKEFKSANDREITFSVVGLRIDEWTIATTTPKRKREGGPRKHKDINGNPLATQGESVGSDGLRVPDPFPTATATQRAKGAEKPFAKALDKCTDPFVIMRKRTPELYHGLIAKIEKGSKASALKLGCLTCAGFVRAEVKYCQVYSCPIHPVRPYQEKDDSEMESESIDVGAGNDEESSGE